MKRFKRIYIEITNICNLTCSFCPPTYRHPEFMTIDQFYRIIQQVKSYTDFVYFHIKGEPLLHPFLGAFLKIAKENKIHVNITTNGTMLKSHLQLLQAYSPRQINVSLHSNEASGQYDDTYLQDVFDFTHEIVSHTDTILNYRVWNLSKNDYHSHLQYKNHQLLQRLEKEFLIDFSLLPPFSPNKGIKLARTVFLSQDFVFQWPSMKAPYVGEKGYCYGLKNQIGILVDGTVVPCCLDNHGDIALGNIFTESMEDILSKSRAMTMLKGFSQRIVIEKLCQHCGFRERF